MFGHASGFIGVSAVILYSLGVIKTIGHLRASDVDWQAGLELIPLDRHLRNGIAIMISPVALAFLFASLATWSALVRGVMSIPSDMEVPPVIRTFTSKYWLPFMLVAAWAVALVPWLYALLIVLVAACLRAFELRIRKVNTTADFKRLVIASHTAITILVIMTYAAVAYFFANPLPNAEIQMGKTTIAGPLITNTEALIFIGDDGKAIYREVPAARVTTIRVVKRERKKEPNLIELVGLR